MGINLGLQRQDIRLLLPCLVADQLRLQLLDMPAEHVIARPELANFVARIRRKQRKRGIRIDLGQQTGQ
ncbi:hypothetical protein D3C79_1003180 [compost metagenome]